MESNEGIYNTIGEVCEVHMGKTEGDGNTSRTHDKIECDGNGAGSPLNKEDIEFVCSVCFKQHQEGRDGNTVNKIHLANMILRTASEHVSL